MTAVPYFCFVRQPFFIVSSRIMPSESYQPVLQKPEEEVGFLECESRDTSLAAISGLRPSYQRLQQLIIAQGIILGVLLVVIAGILWKSQAVESGCPYKSTDGQLPDHVYCTSSFPLITGFLPSPVSFSTRRNGHSI
jgi:hypothetical protein